MIDFGGTVELLSCAEQMSSGRQAMTVRDLVDEAKKRIVVLVICVVGLSYLMSLTSSSVWVNLPVAASLIITFRYLSMDFDMRRKAAVYNSRPTTGNIAVHMDPFEDSKPVVQRSNWRRKVKSPVVEDAIDQFTRHLVSEWVTNLWYSKLTPDTEGPEELVQIINGVIGEFSRRMRNINLIDLLTRDIIHRACKHLELFRECQAKIAKTKLEPLTFYERDMELKLSLAAENRLHPALFSTEAEHKVLQHLMEGLIYLTFKPEDLQCSFFRYVVRELLACAVMRPILNMANPRFINERMEQVVLSIRKGNKGSHSGEDAVQPRQNGPPKVSIDHFSRDLDPSVSGVELVQLKSNSPKSLADEAGAANVNGSYLSKDPLLYLDARTTRSLTDLPLNRKSGDGKDLLRPNSGREWSDMLDYFSDKKTEALAPENFENMWTKGRDFKNKDAWIGKEPQGYSGLKAEVVNPSNIASSRKQTDGLAKGNSANKVVIYSGSSVIPRSDAMSTCPSMLSDEDEANESESSSFYSSENEESIITGLDTPTTKVWDGRTIRNVGVSRIRHPLESKDGKLARRANAENHHRLPRSQAGRSKSGQVAQDRPVWQEIERTSFLSGDGQDILKPKHSAKDDDSSDEYDLEIMNRVQSNNAASSSAHSIPESYKLATKSPEPSFFGNTFFKLRCEVLGANIVKSSSKLFAVYSISVADADNNSWSIKRRFRHFEELHRRLKEYSEYSLHLPPKHFLSTGLDVPVIQERCILLDRYLKMLMRIPTISGSIEVWDFLSVDSQTYTFSSTFSIVETLSVHMDDKPSEKNTSISSFGANMIEPFNSKMEHGTSENKVHSSSTADGLKLDTGGKMNSFIKKPGKEYIKHLEEPGNNVDITENKEGGDTRKKSELTDALNHPALPTEWVPPNLSAPMLDLVDVIFQLQEGGWIRRKAFWVVKQVLQLGMGDALDDWLIEKIRLLRRGPVVASVIKRIEQILWPDGIFITKHPKRQRPPLPSTPKHGLPHNQQPDQVTSPKGDDIQNLEEEKQREADRRAKFVYELMIDNAPAAVVSLVGRKEYEQCAKDLYFFLQSSVCLKQLSLDLLELVIVSAFPELDHCVKQLHEEKHKFGEFKPPSQ